MSDETRHCLNCGGIVYGPWTEGALVCGDVVPSLPKGVGPARTKCRAARVRAATAERDTFKTRVATLLKKWQYGTEDMCPACGADVMPSFPQWKHRDDCALAALLREAQT